MMADHATREAAPAARRLPWARLAAASVLIAAASSALTFALVRRPAGDSIDQQVVASHIRALMPGHLMDVASNDQHNVKPWFNGRVDVSPSVPRLDSLGYPLLGGRVDYVAGRAVPVIVYGRRKHVVDVFVTPANVPSDRPDDGFTANGFHVVRWTSGGEEFRAVSDIGAPELRQFAALFARGDSAGAMPQRE